MTGEGQEEPGLSAEQRAALDARDLTNWTRNQLHAEIARRTAGADGPAERYWLGRLLAAVAVEEALAVLRAADPYPGLRTEREGAEGFRLLHKASGLPVNGCYYLRRGAARSAAARLAAAADWTLPWDELGTEHHAAARQEERDG
ncbi:hypothetical protein [Kitasatospora purpeofusca]|uniref:hypothetical protein n=1 Tax=Kitasatospora purpeofusca TaxID=67352 RepID=UPI00368CDF98